MGSRAARVAHDRGLTGGRASAASGATAFRRGALTGLLLTCLVPAARSAPVAGDVDGSGGVSVVDVEWTVLAVLGSAVPHACDVDHDAIVGSDDVDLVVDAVLERLTDSDGDGLADVAEGHLGTDPGRRDSDGDGVGDGEEVLLGTDPLAAPTAFDPWDLWTSGTQLRGANVHQRRVYPDLDGTDFLGPGPVGPPFVQADFDALAALGANWVNLSHPGLFAEEPPHALDLDVQDNLDRLLALAEQADLFAVISFRTGPGRSEFTFFDNDEGWFDPSVVNDSAWEVAAAQEAWVAMWTHAAQRYRNHAVVVGYDLMVEPNAAAALHDIWDPDEFHPAHSGGLDDWNQLHPRIAAGIRAVDAVTPILVSSESFGAVEWLPWLVPNGEPRVVYTVHPYGPHAYSHQEPPLDNSYPGVFDANYDGVAETVDRAWLEAELAPIDAFRAQHGVPVAANEFGTIRWQPGADLYVEDQIDLLEARGLNHAYWEFGSSHPPYLENDEFRFMHGPDPGNHQDVTSDLRTVIETSWAANVVRPSTVD
jgi:hypothetical protein